MNYDRAFLGMPALPEQRMIPYGELKCYYSGKPFQKAVVDAYNQYTKDFNNTRYRSTQEFLLDQRHRYIHMVMQENLNSAYLVRKAA